MFQINPTYARKKKTKVVACIVLLGNSEVTWSLPVFRLKVLHPLHWKYTILIPQHTQIFLYTHLRNCGSPVTTLACTLHSTYWVSKIKLEVTFDSFWSLSLSLGSCRWLQSIMSSCRGKDTDPSPVSSLKTQTRLPMALWLGPWQHQFSSLQSLSPCLTCCDPMEGSTQASLSITNLWSLQSNVFVL